VVVVVVVFGFFFDEDDEEARCESSLDPAMDGISIGGGAKRTSCLSWGRNMLIAPLGGCQ
jgi:hypothetical protein